jgi:hypothetical protein
MRKHILFFVHGMGAYVNASGTPNHSWSKSAAKALKQQYDQYALLKSVPFESRFDVVHINYDTEFHKILKRWDDEAQKILASGDASGSDVTKLLAWIQGGSQIDENFAWTHASDVILYKFFSLVRQRIKVHVANQFRTALAPNADGAVTSWSVIAHSLGTIVTHDVLHALDSTTPNEAGISILDSMVPSANVVAMIANVTKIMENDVDVYASLVVPSSAVQMNSACFHYLSCNNQFDPFVIPEPFNPSGRTAWDVALANETFLDIETENVHHLNVHSLANYMVNPAVHIPLLERMCGSGSILPDEKQAAFDNFVDIPDESVEEAFDLLIDEFEDEEWIQLIGKLYARWNAANE